jgi:hypothetical protein
MKIFASSNQSLLFNWGADAGKLNAHNASVFTVHKHKRVQKRGKDRSFSLLTIDF